VRTCSTRSSDRSIGGERLEVGPGLHARGLFLRRLPHEHDAAEPPRVRREGRPWPGGKPQSPISWNGAGGRHKERKRLWGQGKAGGATMLTLVGNKRRYCDGVSRRSFLRVGALAMGGLSLPTLLQAEQRAGRSSNRSVIMVYLSGGLSHHDSFDLKPEAPREIAGEFRPIATRVPGIRIGEHLPRLAALMDRLAVVRSVVGLRDEHSSFQTLTRLP